MTCQSLTSLSMDPPLVSFAVTRTSSSWARIKASSRFAVNVNRAEWVPRRGSRPSALHRGLREMAGGHLSRHLVIRDRHVEPQRQGERHGDRGIPGQVITVCGAVDERHRLPVCGRRTS
ncbi:flavin reductase family protein [Lentzea guizhouensis]|uniref:flavin reductase family protein n=1 Tax=Lentzea guizhouensis TaxID=1586287 RepID=UPI003AAAE31A